MQTFKALRCYNCGTIIIRLPIHDILKMTGLSFQCECCGLQNLLTESYFLKSSNNDSDLYTYNIEKLLQ